MTTDQMRHMIRAGHHFGGHGYGHEWMGEMDLADQQADISGSMAFIDSLVPKPYTHTFCYPYGSYNQDTKDCLCDDDAAFTTTPEIYDTDKHHRLEIPRLDCNDITKMM